MASLVVKQLCYSGDTYFYKSPELKRGLNIIEGTNGSGKTTFFMLLYYSFGGKVPEFEKDYEKRHQEITSDTNGFVETFLQIGDDSYQIKRFIGANEIIVTSVNDLEILNINRGRNNKETFSDWILGKLNIPMTKFSQGGKQFYLSIYDYFRIFYHDQTSDPDEIFKKVDKKNVYTDSREIRNAIFQIMLGEHSAEYYQKLSEMKSIQVDLNSCKAKVEEYKSLSAEHSGHERKNSTSLETEIIEFTEQIQKLYRSREISKKTRHKNTFQVELASLRSKASDFEMEATKLEGILILKRNQKANFVELRKQSFLELEQLKKIIATHQEFNLFSSTSCPYCLNQLERPKGICYCGNVISEEDYERFFYENNEYIEIFKSKKRSLSTVDDAIVAVAEEIDSCLKKLHLVKAEIEKLSSEIDVLTSNIVNDVDYSKIDRVDDKILTLKQDVNDLKFVLKIQIKLEKFQNEFNKLEGKYSQLSNRVRLLSSEIDTDLENKLDEFNRIYSRFMKSSLDSCFDAKINPVKYTPVINNSEYKEASSKVSIRLNYFLTLFQLSLNHPTILFPKFLLIDTPQSSGIDKRNLIKALSQAARVEGLENGQIILSTGLDTLPDSIKNKVVIRLEKEIGEFLLKKK